MPNDPSRVDKMLLAIKNRPIVAFLIVAAICFLAVISWTNNVITQSTQLAERFGIRRPAGENSIRSMSYRLGKQVAAMSFLETTRTKIESSVNLQGEEANRESQLKTYLDDLHINTKFENLDFVSRVLGNYQDSSAASFLKEQVLIKYGAEAVKAYELGLELEGYRWAAFSKQFALPSSNVGEDAFVVLGALSEMSKHFGAEGVSANQLDGPDLSGFNISMRLLIEKLEGQVEAHI
ncbi:MAG TPA: hypothetical protein VGS07_21820 [Thermoanaerobaculia bacterium]|jgi:hypothetical protein|nr:hypothetical protein [Thermoanaerobaculia bacterium]